METINLKDFFDTYQEFAYFMAVKIASVKQEQKEINKHIRRSFNRIRKIGHQPTIYFITRWIQLNEPYLRYASLTKELKRLKHYIMLGKIQFQGKSIEEFKPLAIEKAREVPVTEILDTISERTPRFKNFYRCPLHNETSGSLKVYKNNSWYCFGCCKGGTAIDLVMKFYDLDLSEAVKYLMGG